MNSDHEPFISSELRPRVVPGLEDTPAIDPDADVAEVEEACLQVLGLSREEWDSLHPELSGEDLLNCVFEYHPDVTWKSLDDETVILHLGTSQYYTLNGSGATIWSLFAEHRPLRELVERIRGQFDVDAKQATTDLLAFTGRLRAENLLQKRPCN